MSTTEVRYRWPFNKTGPTVTSLIITGIIIMFALILRAMWDPITIDKVEQKQSRRRCYIVIGILIAIAFFVVPFLFKMD